MTCARCDREMTDREIEAGAVVCLDCWRAALVDLYEESA